MALKTQYDTFNKWSLTEDGGYYDHNAGMFFERGDCGGVTTFLFK
jgi:hypothetical protein